MTGGVPYGARAALQLLSGHLGAMMDQVPVERLMDVAELENVNAWTLESVRAVIDKALDEPKDEESITMVDRWFDCMHSRIYHIIKAFCGHNQTPVRAWDDPEHRECLSEIVSRGTRGNPGPAQPLYVWYLKDLLENTALKVCGSHFIAVFSNEELLRRCLVDYLWNYIG